MKKVFVWMIGVVCLIGTSVESQPWGGGHHGQSELQEAIELIEDAVNVGENSRYPERGFRLADYKLRTAEMKVRSVSTPSQEKETALEAIGVAREKITDQLLSVSERRWILNDCAQVAINNIEVMIQRGDERGLVNLQTVMDHLDRANAMVRNGDYRRADNQLARAQNILQSHYRNERDLHGTVRGIQSIRDYIANPRYSYHQKVRFTDDCVQDLKRQIRHSNAYRREGHGGGRPPRPQPPRPQPPRPQPPQQRSCANYDKRGFTIGGRDTRSMEKTCSSNTRSGRVFVHNVSLALGSRYLSCDWNDFNGGRDARVTCHNSSRSSKRVNRITLQCCNYR